jgi:HSP20 family protein
MYMPLRDLEFWMWAEACEMLDRADRLHRQFFRPAVLPLKRPTWEPPVDVYETDDEFIIMMALPGVSSEDVSVILEDNRLFIRGQRNLSLRAEAHIRRLEIPYGRFERYIELPEGCFELGAHELVQGCLFLTLRKI